MDTWRTRLSAPYFVHTVAAFILVAAIPSLNAESTQTNSHSHTTLSTSRTPTRKTHSHTPPPTSSPTSPSRPHHSISDQTRGFYYIFAALIAVFFAFCFWLFHVRRKKRRLIEAQAQGRGALELDIDRMPYPNNRRWTGRAGFYHPRRDEGLNEQGEAPPPYKPAGAQNTTLEPGQSNSIPLQPLEGYSNTRVAKPPDYQEREGNA